MGQVTVHVNDKPFLVGCEDGQEAHLIALARRFDEQVRAVASQVGSLGDARLFLMAGLMMADELAEAHGQLGQARRAAADSQGAGHGVQLRAAEAIDAAAARIESLAERLGQGGA